MPIQEGQQAPDFTIYSHATEPFTLSEQGGPVLLLFFPGAFTSVCTSELNEVNNEQHRYGGGTTIVGISTDSPFVLNEFREVNAIDYELLSDHDGAVSAAYGAKYDHDFTDMKLDRIAKRAAFLVDADGVVRYAEVLDNAGHLPNFDAIEERVATL